MFRTLVQRFAAAATEVTAAVPNVVQPTRATTSQKIKKPLSKKVHHQIRRRPVYSAPTLEEIKPKLKFPIADLPKSDKPSGWTPPLGVTQKLPFDIHRTDNLMLPVYSDIRNGGSKYVTILRKIYGDVEAVKHELRIVCGGAPVTEKCGRLEVNGDFRKPVRAWLKALGF